MPESIRYNGKSTWHISLTLYIDDFMKNIIFIPFHIIPEQAITLLCKIRL